MNTAMNTAMHIVLRLAAIFTIAFVVSSIAMKLDEEKEAERRSADAEFIRGVREICEQQNGKACEELAFAYDIGRKSLERDDTRALEYALKACDFGNAQGCVHGGNILSDDNPALQDFVKALGIYERGCKLGNPVACGSLGTLYEDGLGTPRDFAVAGSYYEMACGAGEVKGCYYLGLRYHKNLLRDDAGQARKLFRQSCMSGIRQACSVYEQSGNDAGNPDAGSGMSGSR